MPLKTTGRNEHLLKRYPFLQRALDDAVKYFSAVETRVSIVVNPGDTNLLYRACDNAWYDHRFFDDTTNPNAQIKQLEWFYPVNAQGELGLKRECKSTDPRTLFVKSLFEGVYLRDWPRIGKEPFDVVDSIVWVTLGHWYEDRTVHFNGSRDRPSKRAVSITLFRQPRRGWKRLYTGTDPLKNVRLFGPRLLPGIKANDNLHIALTEATREMAEQLNTGIIAQGLGEIISTCPSPGMSGAIGDVQIHSLAHAGGVTIALERDHISFVVSGDDDFTRLRLNHIGGTVTEVSKMLKYASKRWRALSSARRLAAHQPDTGIHLL